MKVESLVFGFNKIFIILHYKKISVEIHRFQKQQNFEKGIFREELYLTKLSDWFIIFINKCFSTSGTGLWDTYPSMEWMDEKNFVCGGKCLVMVHGVVAQLVSLCEFTVSTRHKSQVQARKSIYGISLFNKFADVLPSSF